MLTTMKGRLWRACEAPLPAHGASRRKIGQTIRALRLARGTSRAELSHRAGISRVMLTRIEHGGASASRLTLHRIALGLELLIAPLFPEKENEQNIPNGFCHVAAGQGVPVEGVGAMAGYRLELLGHLRRGKILLEPALVTLDADAKPYAGVRHQGLRFLHLLAGRAIYRHGERRACVAPGDSLLFDANAAHGIEAIVQAPVSYLSIVFSLQE